MDDIQIDEIDNHILFAQNSVSNTSGTDMAMLNATIAQALALRSIALSLADIAAALDNDNARDALAQSVALYGNGK